MRVSTTVRIVRNNTPQVAAAIDTALADVVERFARIVAQDAQQIVPVRTGALRASIAPRPTLSPLEWEVVATMLYAVLVEMGEANRPARPYLLPSLMAVRHAFIAACRQAVASV